MSERGMSTAQLCKVLGVSRATTTRWANAGCPCSRSKGRRGTRWNLDEVREWMDRVGRDGSPGGDGFERAPVAGEGVSEEVEQSDNPRDELLRARIRSTVLTAMRTELKLKKERGEVLQADEVEQGRQARVAYARSVLLGGPASLSMDLVGLTADEIEFRLRAWVESALSELAS